MLIYIIKKVLIENRGSLQQQRFHFVGSFTSEILWLQFKIVDTLVIIYEIQVLSHVYLELFDKMSLQMHSIILDNFVGQNNRKLCARDTDNFTKK